MNRHLGLVVAAALLAACSARETKPEARRDPPFVMPHSPHVEGEVDCLECHAPIAKATVAGEPRPPRAAAQEGPRSAPAATTPSPKLQVPARTRDLGLHFDHAAHLARLKGEKNACLRCHTSVPEQKADGVRRALDERLHQLPQSRQQDFAAARCLSCHEDLKRYEKPVESFKHQGEFLKLHGALARGGAESCAACHEQTFCADCHSPTTVPGKPSFVYPEDVKRDIIHRGDYQSRHMVDVEANPASCRKCHGSNFCLTCHEQQNLMQPPGSLTPPRNPHPHRLGHRQDQRQLPRRRGAAEHRHLRRLPRPGRGLALRHLPPGRRLRRREPAPEELEEVAGRHLEELDVRGLSPLM